MKGHDSKDVGVDEVLVLHEKSEVALAYHTAMAMSLLVFEQDLMIALNSVHKGPTKMDLLNEE